MSPEATIADASGGRASATELSGGSGVVLAEIST